jgi:hypothetical protein
VHRKGLPQSIQLAFPSSVLPRRITLTFQGGFVGKHCSILYIPPSAVTAEWLLLDEIFPEDVNRKQTFDLQTPAHTDGVQQMKLVFKESSDFFGRVTVYDLSIDGEIVAS